MAKKGSFFDDAYVEAVDTLVALRKLVNFPRILPPRLGASRAKEFRELVANLENASGRFVAAYGPTRRALEKAIPTPDAKFACGMSSLYAIEIVDMVSRAVLIGADYAAQTDDGWEKWPDGVAAICPTQKELEDLITRLDEEWLRVTPPTAKRGGRVEWKVAQSLMLTRLKDGTLPKSIRDAARTIVHTYSTTRKAACESDSLKTHFGLSGAKPKRATGELLKELASQADARTRRYLENLPQDEREAVETQLREMPAANRLELLKTLAASPDGGSCGDVPLRDDEAAPDSE